MFFRSTRKASPPFEQPYAFTIAGRVTFLTAENDAHLRRPRLTPQACNSTEASPPAQRGHVCAGLFYTAVNNASLPSSCKRAPSAAIRKEGAIEEEEEEGKVEVKGEEKGLSSALSLFVLLAVVTPARGGGQEKKEGKKKRWRKAALLLLLLHSLIASMTGRPQ